jgi:transketolase
MSEADGIRYLRTSRGETPVIYPPDEDFPIGGSKTLPAGEDDQVTIIAAGITVPEALKAADRLAADGIAARVIDLYSLRPVDIPTLRDAAERTGRFVAVEDHWPEGGLGDAVLDAFANGHRAPRLTKLTVWTMPGSATPDEQLHAAGIDAEAITAAALKLTRTIEESP